MYLSRTGGMAKQSRSQFAVPGKHHLRAYRLSIGRLYQSGDLCQSGRLGAPQSKPMPPSGMGGPIRLVADPDLFDDLMMMAPMLYQFGMAIMAVMMTMPVAIVAVFIVVLLMVMMTANLVAIVAIIRLNNQLRRLGRHDDRGRPGKGNHGSKDKIFHYSLLG
jgi:hypothetical protein